MDLAEQAITDPRVGDKWTTLNGHYLSGLSVDKVDDEWIGFNAHKGHSTLDRERFANFVEGWTLAERGPAPAKKERDPKKDPRAGDKFEARGRQWSDEVVHRDENSVFTRRCISGFFHSEKDISIDDWPEYVKHDIVVFIAPEVRARDPYTTPVVGDEWKRPCDANFIVKEVERGYVRGIFPGSFGMTPANYPRKIWDQDVQKWTLYRKGDDPLWRPEGERSEHGIKVGDRVQHMDGDEGVIESIVDGLVNVLFDNEDKPYPFTVNEAGEWLTIIPPTDAPDQDDTGDEPPTPDIVTNENGAKQSRLAYRCDLLPPKATLHVSEILRRGAEKYGDKNYLGISTADHINHALTHVLQYLAGDVSEDHLGNATARMLFALETKGN